jgi:hypothetical protein
MLVIFLSDPKVGSDFHIYPPKLFILLAKFYSENAICYSVEVGQTPRR